MTNDMDKFTYTLGEYLREAYRRGCLDGEDAQDDIEPTRWFNDKAVARVAAELKRLL